jgi:hypothetical protein
MSISFIEIEGRRKEEEEEEEEEEGKERGNAPITTSK